MKLIKQGAEARLYLSSYLGKQAIVKERFSKKYRHPALDERLTKERIRNEVKGNMRAKSAGIRTPAIYTIHPLTGSIYMEYIEGYQTVDTFIRETLNNPTCHDNEELSSLADSVGECLGKLHQADVIHGDLTTSNILVNKTSDRSNSTGSIFSICLIDFGLSHVDNSAEDKGVDLYVLERAILSTHSNIQWFFDQILQSYLKSYSSTGQDVCAKLEEIRLRGRKRTMIG